MIKGFYLQILEDEEGRQRLREAMESGNYLMITPARRPTGEKRKTKTGLKALGVHADQIFINRLDGRPELIVGHLGKGKSKGKGKKIDIFLVGWEPGRTSKTKPEEQSSLPAMEWPEWPKWPEYPEWPKWPEGGAS